MRSKTVFFANLIAATMGIFTQNAQALEAGDFMAPDVIRRLLDDEGQKAVVLVDGYVESGAKEVAVIFTTDKDGKTGYELASDQPLGTAPNNYRVVQKFSHVHLNFDRTPPNTLFDGTDPETAQKQCDKLVHDGIIKSGLCRPLKQMIEAGTKSGQRILFWGDTASDSKLIVAAVTVDGVPTSITDQSTEEQDRGCTIISMNGATVIASIFHNVSTTDAFKKFIGKQ
jgi:hypothetical protein